MQMAEVAATVANDGTLMKPTFLQKATRPRRPHDRRSWTRSEQSKVVSPETANELTDDDDPRHRGGNGGRPHRPGDSFAGKTGTAEIDVGPAINRPWFIGFAPADDPQIAVAVMLEQCTGCFGGEVAGPIATQVMERCCMGVGS